jgi:hypothetical protein
VTPDSLRDWPGLEFTIEAPTTIIDSSADRMKPIFTEVQFPEASLTDLLLSRKAWRGMSQLNIRLAAHMLPGRIPCLCLKGTGLVVLLLRRVSSGIPISV